VQPNGQFKDRPTGVYENKLYPRLAPIPEPWTQPISPEENPAGKLLQMFRKWNWTRPDVDPVLLLGWIGCAILGGALDRRSSVSCWACPKWPRFRTWTNVFLGARSEFRMALSLPSIFALMRYLRCLVATRRRTPKDDLISALIAVEEGGDRLSENELIAMLVLLIIAGHETTVNLIGSGLLALMENQREKERLLGDFSLIGSAVEELLRFTAPVETATERYAAKTLTCTPLGSGAAMSFSPSLPPPTEMLRNSRSLIGWT
jgi:hypothetical protein